MSEITIDLAALREWETGAPDPDPNRDPALDPDEPNWADGIDLPELDEDAFTMALRHTISRQPSR